MRAVVQRVSRAEVRVGGECVGKIEKGLCVLVGVQAGDTAQDLAFLARKLPALRIFPDEAGKMNKSVVDLGGQMLLISQFTLLAETSKGTRPSFGHAMEPAVAKDMFDTLAATISEQVPVQTGQFQADMDVELVNDGPVTLILDSRVKRGQELSR